MITIDGGLGVLIKGKGAMFWTSLVLAAVLLIAWVVVVMIAYANKKALPHHIPGVMPWRSERPWDWQLEVLEIQMKNVLGRLLVLAVDGNKAAVTERTKRETTIVVDKLIAYVAKQLMSAMATRWMVLAIMLLNVPLVYVAGLFSAQGDYALLTSMVGNFVFLICLGYFVWNMRQYIAHHGNVDQLTTCLTIIASISMKTVESYIPSLEAAHFDMYELGDCDAQRMRSKNAVTDVTRLLETLRSTERYATHSLCQASAAVLLSLALQLYAYFASEAYFSPAFVRGYCLGLLIAAVVFYGNSSRHLRTFHNLLR